MGLEDFEIIKTLGKVRFAAVYQVNEVVEGRSREGEMMSEGTRPLVSPPSSFHPSNTSSYHVCCNHGVGSTSRNL